MKRKLMVAAVLFAGFLAYGCQPPEGTDDAPASPGSGTTSAVDSNATSQFVRADHPKQAVKDFLNALKGGDQDAATSMLTTKAQEETTKRSMAIQPPGSQSAKYTVTEFELFEEQDEAHVFSTWTDVDEREIQQTYDIVWILKRENTGWGIKGFATRVFEDHDPIILDFENPEKLLQQKKWAEQEVARRHQSQNQKVATKPEATDSTR